jgi:hypothetical protein
MGEAKNRADDIEATKAAAQQQAQQMQLMAAMTQKPATFVNGAYVVVVGGLVRFTLHEMVNQALGAVPKFEGVVEAATLVQVGNMFVQVGEQVVAMNKAAAESVSKIAAGADPGGLEPPAAGQAAEPIFEDAPGADAPSSQEPTA